MDFEENKDDLQNEKIQPKTGLQFEFSADDFQKSDFPTKEDGNKEDIPDVETSKIEEEFSIPKELNIEEKPETKAEEEKPIRVGAMYVPRFTEVSDNYRMAHDKKLKIKEETKEIKTSSHTVSVVTSEKKDSTNPTTEEIDKKKIDKVVVTPNNKNLENSSDEKYTIYKFEPSVAEKSAISEEEDIVKIVEATVKDALNKNDSVEEPEEQIAETIPEQESAPAQTEEKSTSEETDKKEYSIPDPESKYKIIDYSSADADSDSLSSEEAPKETIDGENEVFGNSKEFTVSIQRDEFKDRFLDSRLSVKVRLIASLILLVGMAVVDVLWAFNIKVTDYIGLSNVSNGLAVLDFMCVCCLFLLAIPEVVRMFKYLFHGFVLPEITLLASFLIEIIYTSIVVSSGNAEYFRLGVLFGMQSVSVIIASLLKISADYSGFKLISKNCVKNILDKRLTRHLQRENMALDGLIDEYSSKTARMFRTTFISDFFQRTAKTRENSLSNIILLSINFGVSLVFAVIIFFVKGNSLVDFAFALGLTFMLGVPLVSIFMHKVLYNRAQKNAESETSTFVGEDSIYAFSDVDVVAYEDTEIFGEEDVSIKKVHLYGQVINMSKAMKYMYSIFSAVGGPLEKIFTDSLDRKCEQASDIVIEDDGISGAMRGHKICCGTESYMKRHKVIIPDDDYRTKTNATDSTRVMYGAEDGSVFVKFFIRYSFSEEFTMTLPLLKEEKIIPLIYTKDPNINLELIRVLTLGDDIIRVMKKKTLKVKDNEIYRKVSAGIVTLGDKENAINMLLLSKKYVKYQKRNSLLEKIALGVGTVVSAIVVCLGATTVPTTGLAIIPFAICAYFSIRTILNFRVGKNKG